MPEKAEYVADITYGDGKAMDVGTERALSTTLNNYHDYKSAHQCPVLFNGVAAGGGITYWFPVCSMIVFYGTEMVGATVYRTVTVAPFFRSATGVSASMRATLSRVRPVDVPGEWGLQYENPRFTDLYSTATWTTTSTTWATGSDATLSLGVKDPWRGVCWLVLEVTGQVETRGLAKCIEGARTGTF